jgi:hypothetical protein
MLQESLFVAIFAQSQMRLNVRAHILHLMGNIFAVDLTMRNLSDPSACMLCCVSTSFVQSSTQTHCHTYSFVLVIHMLMQYHSPPVESVLDSARESFARKTGRFWSLPFVAQACRSIPFRHNRPIRDISLCGRRAICSGLIFFCCGRSSARSLPSSPIL